MLQIFSSLGTILRIVTFTKSGKFPTSADWVLLTIFLSLTVSWVNCIRIGLQRFILKYFAPYEDQKTKNFSVQSFCYFGFNLIHAMIFVFAIKNLKQF